MTAARGRARAVVALLLVWCAAAQNVNPGLWTQVHADNTQQTDNTGEFPYVHYGVSFVSVPGGDVYLYGRPYDLTPWEVFVWRTNLDDLNGRNLSDITWEKLFDTRTDSHSWDPVWMTAGVHRNDQFLIFGGVTFNSDPEWSNGWLLFDTDDNDFAERSGPDEIERRQSSALTLLDDGDVIMFGGCGSTSGPDFPNHDDMWKYTVSSDNWQDMDIQNRLKNSEGVIGDSAATGLTFAGRCGQSQAKLTVPKTEEFFNTTTNETQIIVVGEREIIIYYGGHANGGFLDEMWEYDIEENWLTPIYPAGQRPSPRCYHGVVVVSNIMLMFGGDGTGRDHLNDLWAYIYELNRWVNVNPSGVLPDRRSHFGMTHVPESNAIALYGGVAHELNGDNRFLSDLWVFGIGCVNDCSGNGECLSLTVCNCRVCYGGADCSTRINNDASCTENVEVDDGYKSGETSSDTLIYSLVGVVVGAILLCLLLALLFSLFAMILFRRWKRKQEAMASREASAVELDPFADQGDK